MQRDTRFLSVGVVFGALVGAAGCWAFLSYQSTPPEDAATYDACLAGQGGGVAACQALMRLIQRERTSEQELIRKAETLLAGGFTKREVVEWALKNGFTGSQAAKVVGISWREMIDGKY